MKRVSRVTRTNAGPLRGGSVPRDVRLTTNGRFVVGIALVFMAGALAAAVILPVVRASQLAERAAVTADASPASARIVGITSTKGEDPRHDVTYRYSAGEREYENTVRVGGRERRRLSMDIGSRLPILYRRSQPARSWLPGRERGVLPAALLPIVPVALLLIAGAFAWGVRRARVLLSEGRFADARVLTSEKVKNQHSSVYRVRYEFTTLAGATMTGAVDRGRPAGSPGETIRIVYHRDNPQWNAIYPLSLVTPDKP